MTILIWGTTFVSTKVLLREIPAGPAGAGTVHPEYFRGHPAVPRGAGHGLSRQGHAPVSYTHLYDPVSNNAAAFNVTMDKEPIQAGK